MKDEHFAIYSKLDSFGKGRMKVLVETVEFCQKMIAEVEEAQHKLKPNDPVRIHLAGQKKSYHRIIEKMNVKIKNLKKNETSV